MKIFIGKPGVVCAAGKNIDELWTSVINADFGGIQKKTICGNQEFYAAEVTEDGLLPSCGRYDSKLLRMEETALHQIEKTVQLAVSKYGSGRVGVCVGSCDNLTELSSAPHKKYFETGSFGEYNIERQSAHYVATYIKERYKLDGVCNAFSTACSSSGVAIIKAAQLIKSGMADAVIAGGIDIASDTTLLGFGSLEAISSEPVNPFSKNRHGITLGEAAVFFVLCREDLEDTKIVLAGYGESADAYHMTSPEPNGAGAAAAMEKALKSADIKAEQIGYLNLHGTGTKFNDSMEAKAVDAVFGSYKVPCSSTKSETGHTLGAAASLELAVCFKALQVASEKEAGSAPVLPAQHWDKVQDEELPVLNIIDSEWQKTNNAGNCSPLKFCMSNSFAFGGSNTSLIIGIEN